MIAVGGRLVLVLVLLGAMVCVAPQAPAEQAITLGTISEEPSRAMRFFLPLAVYLRRQIAADGFDAERVVVADSVDGMATLLRDAKVDVYLDGPIPAFAVSERSGAKPVLRWWVGGKAEDDSVIFARVDGGMKRPEDLSGQVVAMENAFSSFGYLLPRMQLEAKGISLRRLDRVSDAVRRGEVGYVLSGDSENTFLWVTRGKVPAGAMARSTLDRFVKKGVGGRIQVIHEAAAYPSGIVLIRSSMAGTLAAKVVSALEKMSGDKDGLEVLHGLNETARFEAWEPEMLAPLENVRPFVQADFSLR